MSQKNGKFKYRGSNSKKAQRVASAKARAEEFASLSPDEQKKRKASNKQEYHYWHDEEQHLNGGEREVRRELGLPLHS